MAIYQRMDNAKYLEDRKQEYLAMDFKTQKKYKNRPVFEIKIASSYLLWVCDQPMLGYTGSREPRLFVQNLQCCLSARRICNSHANTQYRHVKSGHYRPASKTPSERRFAGGPIVALDWILAGHVICRGRPFNSFAVSRAPNSIDPDQTEPTLFAKNISKMFHQKTKQTRFIVISVFSAFEILFVSKMLFFSLKSAQTLMKSRIMLAAIHRGLRCLPKCLF